uniref:Protein kinase n=1 Tax=Solanum tuberosum TaxID=4113 RepID=M1DNX4_SOLTU
MFKHSPFIVHSFGANVSFEDNVNLYNLLLVYASGGSLADRLQNCNSLSVFEVKKHTKNVLLGLNCIHNKGIIHCDIKLGNILLVRRDKTAKIAYFGLFVTVEQGMDHIKSSSKVANTTKTRKKKIDSMYLLHKPIQKITFKISHHKLSRQLLDPKPLVHKQIQKITFKIDNHKFVRQFPDLKEIANETCGRVLGTDNR